MLLSDMQPYMVLYGVCIGVTWEEVQTPLLYFFVPQDNFFVYQLKRGKYEGLVQTNFSLLSNLTPS